MEKLFNASTAPRTSSQWRTILLDLVTSLSQSCGIDFAATSWHVADDQPGHSSYSNCVDIRGTVNASLELEACGALCISGTVGEDVFVSADLLLFSAGRRITGPEGDDIIYIAYDRQSGWRKGRWMRDGDGEWELHCDNARWRKA